jgi:hypothetical protein
MAHSELEGGGGGVTGWCGFTLHACLPEWVVSAVWGSDEGVLIRVAAVWFGPVQRPFSPNPKPKPGLVRALWPNPEPLWGLVQFGSSSGPDPFQTWTEPSVVAATQADPS